MERANVSHETTLSITTMMAVDSLFVHKVRSPYWPSNPRPRSILMGIMCGDPRRRSMIETAIHDRAAEWSVVTHHVFVVGYNTARGGAVENDPHTLIAPVNDTDLFVSGGGVVRTRTGTLVTYKKLATFLSYAARGRSEEVVVRIDDDTWVSPVMLGWYATRMLDLSRRFVGGVFEWYNMVQGRLRSVGLAHGANDALKISRFKGCVKDVSEMHTCVGPFAFPKGPLVMMSRATTDAIVASPLFRRDWDRVMMKSTGLTVASRVDDDVQLGLWISQLENQTYVTTRRGNVWMDARRSHYNSGALLAAHKMPYRCGGKLSRPSGRVSERSVCVASPPCTGGIHLESQRTCMLEVRLDDDTVACRTRFQ